MNIFSDTGVTPDVGASIMDALSMNIDELSNAPRFRKLKDVLTFVAKMDNPRRVMLDVLSNRSGDRLDNAWNWVELQKERSEVIASINPELVTENVAELIAKRRTIPREDRSVLSRAIEDNIMRQATQDTNQSRVEEAVSEIRKVNKIEVLEEQINEYGI